MAIWRLTLSALSGLLVLFHGWLLGSQAWDGRLADPGLLLRWTVAAGLLAALVGLWSRGASLIWGRKPIAIWLLAALLHAPAYGSRIGFDSPALPETVAVVLQVAASVIGGLGLALFAAMAMGRLARPRAACHLAVARAPGAGRGRRTLPFSPRPPPVR